jgi:hypothetical protein
MSSTSLLARRASGRQQVDGFEEVVFLGIAAEEEENAGRKFDLQAAIVAEVAEVKAANVHSECGVAARPS